MDLLLTIIKYCKTLFSSSKFQKTSEIIPSKFVFSQRFAGPDIMVNLQQSRFMPGVAQRIP